MQSVRYTLLVMLTLPAWPVTTNGGIAGPAITAVTPGYVDSGVRFSLAIEGKNFTASSAATLGTTPLTCAFSSPSSLKCAGVVQAAVGTVLPLAVRSESTASPSRNIPVVPASSISISPDRYTLRAGDSKTFRAEVAGASQKTVVWSASHGTITREGIYTAPKVVPTPNAATVKAVLAADTSVSDTATVTLLNPDPVVERVSPSQVHTGLAFSLLVEGKGLLPTSKVTLGTATLSCAPGAGGALTCKGTTAAAPGTTLPLIVWNPAPGPAVSNAKGITVTGMSVSISPDRVSVRLGEKKQFSASVQGTTQKKVNWIAAAGTITADGLYTAPAKLPASDTVTVKATLALDGKTSDTATVLLLNPDPEVKSIKPPSINTGAPFTLAIEGEGFVAASKVTLGGAALSCKFNSASSLTCTGTSNAAGGTVLPLVVSNPNPGAASSSPKGVTVSALGVSVSPGSVSVRLGAKKQFSASVQGTTQKTVNWTATAGTIAADGLYTAPSALPVPNTVTVKATLAIDGKISDTATVLLLNPEPSVTAVKPSSINTGLPFSLSIEGSGFLASSRVTLGGAALACKPGSATVLACTGTSSAAAGTTLPLVVANPDPGAASSYPKSIQVLPPLGVTVSPGTISLRPGESKQFSASVAGTSQKTVTWKATAGTVSAEGYYTAPAAAPTPNVATVTATLSLDGKTAGSASVTILNPQPAVYSLSAYQVNTGLPFSLAITGKGFLASSTATLGDAALACTFGSATSLTCKGTTTAAAGTVLPLVVKNPDPGAASSPAKNVTVAPPIKLKLSPETASVRAGDTKQFYASLENAPDKGVTWKACAGTIDGSGLYTAPAAVPSPAGPVTITASSKLDPNASDTSTVTLLNPVPSITSVSPAQVSPGAVTVTIAGKGFAASPVVTFGSAVFQTVSASPTQVVATGVAAPIAGGQAPVTVSDPDPGGATSNAVVVAVAVANPLVTHAAAVRFLEQATFGADPESVARLQQIGIEKWLAEQRTAAESNYDDPPDVNTGLSQVQHRFFANAMTGQDQLRQRVAFALGQIWVISGVKIPRAVAFVPWLRMLSRHSFGNYLDLMREATLSPAMGNYLDMVNNDKANPRTGSLPNENYARELLQLFTIGTAMLNPDGTSQMDAFGQPVPAYSEETLKQFSMAFTGWTYPPLPGTATSNHNPPYYFGPMVPVEANHDREAKTLLFGQVLAPGQTAPQDVESALQNVFRHPNLGPFVALRMIQHMVTSNPSPAYVQRVAAAFNNNGANVKGDMWAVARAVLLDPEARQGDAAPSGSSHLREPVLLMTSLLRALGATAGAETSLPSRGNDMGQRIFYSPSVFNYYSPFFRTAGGALAGPEFQILSPTTAISRVNFVHAALSGGLNNVRVDLTPFQRLAADPARLIDAVDTALLRGQMSAAVRAEILKMTATVTDSRLRARYALYLAAAAPHFQVER